MIRARTRVALMIGLFVAMALTGACSDQETSGSAPHLIGVIEPLQHIAVSDITAGLEEQLATEIKNGTVEILVANAARESTTLEQIVASYQDRGVDIYVPIFTQTAQLTKGMIREQPIIFAAVTDPVAAGIIRNPEKPDENITGVSDLWPLEAELALIRRLLPNASVIGVPFDPGDPSSAATMPRLRVLAPTFNFRLEERPVRSIPEISQALESFGDKVDLIFTANDVTVTSAFPALVQHCRRRGVPLFAGDYSSVARGAIAAIGQNYRLVGRQAGELISTHIAGTPISDLPVTYTTGGDIYLNRTAAQDMGVNLPEQITSEAIEIYEGYAEQ